LYIFRTDNTQSILTVSCSVHWMQSVHSSLMVVGTVRFLSHDTLVHLM